jgi:predicted RNase H-like HicB family nuclease
MQYQILIKNGQHNGFLASVIGMPECKAIGATKEEAIENASRALREHLAQAEIVTVDIPTRIENPLLKHAGRFKDDETFDDFMAEIAKYRRELDAEEAARNTLYQITEEAA